MAASYSYGADRRQAQVGINGNGYPPLSFTITAAGFYNLSAALSGFTDSGIDPQTGQPRAGGEAFCTHWITLNGSARGDGELALFPDNSAHRPVEIHRCVWLEAGSYDMAIRAQGDGMYDIVTNSDDWRVFAVEPAA